MARTDSLIGRSRAAIARAIESRRRELAGYARALPSATDVLADPSRSLDEIAARLGRSLAANAAAHRARLDRTAAGLSPAGLGRLVSHAAAGIAAVGDRMAQALSVHAERKRSALALRARRLRPAPLTERIASASARLTELGARQRRGLGQRLQSAWQRLEALDKLLDAFSLSKESVLARGYALVHAGGNVVSKASEVPRGGAIEIEFADGRISAIAGTGAISPKRPRRRMKAPDPGQASLFDGEES
jgi:exodeoxyribonuclease VII large subunit